MLKLPFPVLWMQLGGRRDGSVPTDGIADWMGIEVKPAFQDKTCAVFANRPMPPPLQSAVRELSNFIIAGRPADAYDRAKLAELLRLQAAVQRRFEELVALEVDDVQARASPRQPVAPALLLRA